MKLRKPRFNTVTKKSITIILGIGLALLLAVSMMLPSIFYELMKPYFCNHISGLASASATGISYIYTRNNPWVRNFGYDETLLGLLDAYDAPDAEKDAVRQEIEALLPTFTLGNRSPYLDEPGAISVMSYMMVTTEDGDVFCRPENRDLIPAIVNSDWYREIQQDPKPEGTLKFEYSPIFTVRRNGRDYSFMCVEDPFLASEKMCYGMSIVEFSDIKNLFARLEKIGIEDYAFVKEDREILYRNLNERDSHIRLGEYPQEVLDGEQYETLYFYHDDGIDFAVRCTYSYENLKLYIHVPKNVLLAPYEQTFQMFQGILFALFAVFIVIVCLTLKGVLGRLTRLSHQMDRVRGGDYNVKLDDSSGDEIGNLARTFNLMVSRIKDNIHEIIRHQKREQRMQYSLMVSSVDPHFIYNTLNTISFLAKMDRSQEIVAVNRALIGTLKDRLSMKNYKTFDTVEKEKQVLGQYMLIQEYLCHNRMELRFLAEEQDLSLYIPKNILQPLVENAIKHGILLHKDENRQIVDGIIEVSVAGQRENIVITVTDNGVGMEDETIRRFFRDKPPKPCVDGEPEHIGIYNIRMRLEFLYHGNYRIQADSAPGKGTSIRIILPEHCDQDF
ncbi:sensor histidine kinase [Candidatus Soleaferrea massiliensis]|uniref:sensor histidine kinase n=1 Tax=Candidatus Soleaferrea massiliensis TaxID=1470354 RepID=UPI000590898C|nr:ATP-binding protein [Candidatus Soleaferrea massiliensis]